MWRKTNIKNIKDFLSKETNPLINTNYQINSTRAHRVLSYHLIEAPYNTTNIKGGLYIIYTQGGHNPTLKLHLLSEYFFHENK